ncbi:MAG TPA: class I SAM-dependent methyltransferase [Steroidobacteraceae bacterium]|nr:class I SAM-dependent methyltransferase [Steroidobacteraceae bacterium]
MSSAAHWENVYRTRSADQLSWYRPHLETSLRLIEETHPDRKGRIIDVGGGESTLVDDLLEAGYRDLDVLDLSATALEFSRRRMGDRAARVRWHCGDVTRYPLEPSSFDLWHDRAVFHFLTGAQERAAYVGQVARCVRPGGHVIVATFGPQGPVRCSGLPVERYSAEGLHDQFGVQFEPLRHLVEMHRTPAGAEQQFLYCLCRVSPAERRE